ncbi:MAG: tetraacyldisaccharide 4'-kinase [Rhodocyclaceae bacterium]|nr:tetraacyldisaccharide 4'-kinase [Rhodocyclaceae bacterium]
MGAPRAPRHWASRGAAAAAMLPLAALFRGLSLVRRAAYRLRRPDRPAGARPVIVVGNIAVGGSGKTPVVAWLVDVLRRAGHQPGIVSRGYGRSGDGVVVVDADSPVREAGDEPLLLAMLCQCPVVVGRDRTAAIACLVERFPACTVVISDDGMQHYAMARDLELAVVDEQVLANGWLLPAGPLRESRARLGEVDLVLLHGPASEATRRAAGAVPSFEMALAAGDAVRLGDGASRPLAAWSGQQVHAVAGIGRPERFFETLRAAGLQVLAHAFPDHHAFAPADLVLSPQLPILMTAKDAVKCRPFAPADSWELPVRAVIPDEAANTILEMLPDGQSPA